MERSGCAALGIDTCQMALVVAYPDTLGESKLPIGETEVVLFVRFRRSPS